MTSLYKLAKIKTTDVDVQQEQRIIPHYVERVIKLLAAFQVQWIFKNVWVVYTGVSQSAMLTVHVLINGLEFLQGPYIVGN